MQSLTPDKTARVLGAGALRPLTAAPVLTVSAPPFAHAGSSVRSLMLTSIAALAPAAIMAAVAYGLPAVRVMALCGATAIITETLCERLMGRQSSADDYHCLYVGLVLAFLLPAAAPWWLAVMGAASSIVLGKMIFGGLGGSPLSPALVGWAVCRLSWPEAMDAEFSMLASELISPLHHLKFFGPEAVDGITSVQLLLGRQLGGLGASQLWAVSAGGLLLLALGRVRWEIPLAFLTGLVATTGIYWLSDPASHASPLFHLLAGSAIFVAFFAATDEPSSPSRVLPMLLFGLLAGALTAVIRIYGIYPDGAPFAVLLANLFTPMLARIRPKPFGAR
ncbi:RnfABCDGE type electron transport complex subunit D [Desulfocurvibacter africanus]|uniref:Electron transport complex, RnfABCDGE type, D subunit n=1 Tax=Desulfocurvibacter africanus subsp. africanus str. Walvis Bay TaxID=690850 RepID=F3Z1K0_DESAF|nr:RnfABCDGE type electron transport complex subunit D [Desulfocurvibacter africanus]EGJ50031.1 electron transport complex, RnfABCDGE type, D subunit [Desulfocurvibacter africanus subsp. africanus str. Walvis Bay]